MTVERFFELFLEELKENRDLTAYYKFLEDPRKMAFRKAYFCQRLQYVSEHVGGTRQDIWDCGSGYGTTALFLALNGYRVYGNTLEFYFRHLDARRAFWSRYGDVSGFTCTYEDIYDVHFDRSFDTVIVQDTLHHLLPLDEGIRILHRALKMDGRLVVVEENGCNIAQRIKLFRQRGFNRKVEVYDESLQKTVRFADEQIRCLDDWRRMLEKAGFRMDAGSEQYIRFYPPQFFVRRAYEDVLLKEQRIAKTNRTLAKYFFFGINFTLQKCAAESVSLQP
ncbi:MAG TPA: methyltransferase domain-containing protein [Flavisolibacter sp.]